MCWPCNVAGDQSIGSAAAACLAGKRVLVVEDTWVVAKALQSLLEEAGLVVSGPCATVFDAKRLVSEQAPALAVVDLRLKGEMAYDLIDCLHEPWRRCGRDIRARLETARKGCRHCAKAL
jgi:CheY-like chemotaxis protein